METVRLLLSKHYSIKWVGYHSPMHVWVHLHRENSNEEKIIVPLKEDYSEDDFMQVRASFADVPLSNTGTIWSADTRLDILRLASMIGLNVGGDATPGIYKSSKGANGCVMAYDIESDRSRLPLTSFGTLSETILSIATYCSCGDIRLYSLIPGVDFDYILCKDSTDTVRQFLHYVQDHCPQWLTGYNNFGYDNARIMYHAPDEFDPILIRMKVGVGSSRARACYIDVQGTYNIDLITWLDKTARSKYENMSLKTVAKKEQITEKMDFDTADLSNIKRLFEYNIQDCKVTMQLTLVPHILPLISAMCTVQAAPVIDIDRFASGSFGSNAVASFCLSKKIRMDWSPCTQYLEYQGAHVSAPIIGLHEDVWSCDFSSMYPNIIMSANLSIENCKISRTKLTDGAIWQTATKKHFVVGGLKYSFDQTSRAIVPGMIAPGVTERQRIKKIDPTKANALKLSVNSVYGGMGDRHSRIYSPGASSATTAGGRWCKALSESIFTVLGYTILYGDTDSDHIKRNAKSRMPITTPHTAVKILARIFDYTPFPGMSMEVECMYEKIAYFGKKTYFAKVSDTLDHNGKIVTGETISKGMSRSRKDRIGLCRTLSTYIVDEILSSSTRREKQTTIGNMLSAMIDAAIYNDLVLQDVSKIVKRSGQNCYEYTTQAGTRSYLECDSATGEEVVKYSASRVCTMIASEVRSILNITRIGSMDDVLSMSSII